MNILGLSVFCDASAALVSGGEVLCAVEEERLNRIKHFEGMPWLAVDECLRISGMQMRDIDAIAVGWNPWLGWGTRISASLRDSLRRPSALQSKLHRGGNYLQGIRNIIRLRHGFETRFGPTRASIRYVHHHLAHAASAFLASPYEEADVAVADGVGESSTFSLFSGVGNDLQTRMAVSYPHSLGHLYASVTAFLGFRPTSDEGKVMALASFGKDRFRLLFDETCAMGTNGDGFRLKTGILDYHQARHGQFSEEWSVRTKMKPRMRGEELDTSHQDLACSLQSCVERTVFTLLRRELPHAGSRPLAAAGGLFLNSVLNGRLQREMTPDLFVQPAAGDNGVSLGAALHVSSRMDPTFRRTPLRHAFLGTSFDEPQLKDALHYAETAYSRADDITQVISEDIVAGRVVARFDGRMEFGPRALGNRSILASPLHPSMKDILNRKVKHREPFRPFAAALLAEDVDEYFENGGISPFMLKVFYFKPQYRKVFPAVCHVDGSCRLQTVTRDDNPSLHALLMRLKTMTGHGMVLNTSLNVAGEPIVRTPQEALHLFRKTEVDSMALGPFYLRK
ncbi:hypothetical protein KQI65_10085 [bacterium]|nr:hypothetical protein [bacterium]